MCTVIQYLREDDLVVRVSNLDMHSDSLRRRGEAVRPGVVKLYLVVP